MNLAKLLSSCYAKKVSSKDVLRILNRSSTTLATEDVTFAQAKPFEQIPGFRSLPWVGTAWIYYPIIGKYHHDDTLLHDKDKYKLFGDIYRDVFSGQPLLSIFNLKDIETVVKNESKYPPRPALQTLMRYRQERRELYKSMGVVLTYGKEWYDLRFKLQKHMLRPRSIDRYIGCVNTVAQDMVNHLIRIRDSNNEVEDTMDELFKWSLESITFLALNSRLGCLDLNAAPDCDGQKLINAVQTSFQLINEMEHFTGSSIQLWKYFRTPTWRKFIKSMDIFTEIAFKHAQGAMDSIKNGEISADEPTLMMEMLSAKELEPHDIMTMITDSMLAGIDTTSHALGFLLFQLAKNPDKQEKVYQEILKILPSPSETLTPEKLAQVWYLKYCLKESMRLMPVVKGVGRVTERDLVLSGYQIPTGTFILILLQVCGGMEKYFKEADKFIPERWDASREDKPSPFLHLPFGFGIRSCIGRRIAELEVFTLAIEIIRNFKVEYHYEDFELKNRLINTPDRKLKFAFIDRK